MLATFVVSHWKSLMQGAKVRCRYIVVPRRQRVGFTFVKESESTRQGKLVIIIKMEPTSLLIAQLVDPVYFTVEKAKTHRILQYTGRTTPRIKKGNKWEPWDAISVYDWNDLKE